MNLRRIAALAGAIMALAAGTALAGPTAQINIPSTDAKGPGEVALGISNYVRFSTRGDAGTNSYAAGVETGLLPFERIKLELGVDYVASGTGSAADAHPFVFNAKLATAEDALFNGMPAIAVGAYNLGTYDKPEVGATTRQNIAYGLLARTIPVIGRISAGGYYGSQRALANGSNQKNCNSGVMASWDRTMGEVSDKLWLGIDYMSGNNANGEISAGASWSFTKQVTLLAGVVWFNPFYKVSAGDEGAIPGGKPAFTTQLTINLP